MAVQFADGVIVGADSRTTTGSYIGMLFMATVYAAHLDSRELTGYTNHSQPRHR